MSTPHHSGSEHAAEAELQEELRALFLVDTQTYLERYRQIAERLTIDSWEQDIQELYRCIHTIKGGAVTVGAEAILQVSTALEEVLSALRYLHTAPPLGDRHLIQALVEAGELLSSVPADGGDPDQVAAQIAPTLNRVEQLHERVRTDYLESDWDERAQLFHEFAEQGFDLVVLELEMGLEQAPLTGSVDGELLATAQATLAQLSGIGSDLEMAAGWERLLTEATQLLEQPDIAVWQTTWPQYLEGLKVCAKQGGQWNHESFLALSNRTQTDRIPDLHLNPETPTPDALPTEVSAEKECTEEELIQAGAIAALFDDLPLGGKLDLSSTRSSSTDPNGTGSYSLLEESDSQADLLGSVEAESAARLVSNNADADWLDSIQREYQSKPEFTDQAVLPQASDAARHERPIETQPSSPRTSEVQVPVPLERLDRCAQHVIETILAVRASHQYYASLQNQLLPLLNLAKESVQYIAQLRQLQNDYTLLSTTRDRADTNNSPTPERYRQGYLTINRLLENSLRLTELGAEAERFVQQTSTSFQTLEHSVQQLKITVEESRLVPFRTLAFRARAILRDLSTRYDKPARLVVEGEHLALDAGTIRQLEPVLLHLLRNAYDHGLESSVIREGLGKDPQGTIVLSLQRRGNRFSLCIRDDGGGIDPEAIAAAARAKNLTDWDVNTPEAMLNVLTQPGFSSKATASDLSGRGVGLDVVLQQVSALEGQMRLDTALDLGTAFYIDLPVPHLLVRCVVVRSEQQQFAIPADDIALTVLADQLSYAPAPDNSPFAKLAVEDGDGRDMPVLDLYQHWHNTPLRPVPSTAICLRIDRPQEANADSPPSIWLLADDLVEQVDLPIEELPSPLISPPGLLGVSLQGDGSLIPVLNAIALREQAIAPKTQSLAAPAELTTPLTPEEWQPAAATPPGTSSVKRILVVDDAALMRRRIEASLTANGYTVTTRNDGLEAWTWLQENDPPDLVITDIEMPQMDGFTLLERCRSAQFNVPFLVVSSRLSEEWSNEAARLGATDYLTKGFSTPELLQRVQAAISTVPQLA